MPSIRRIGRSYRSTQRLDRWRKANKRDAFKPSGKSRRELGLLHWRAAQVAKQRQRAAEAEANKLSNRPECKPAGDVNLCSGGNGEATDDRPQNISADGVLVDTHLGCADDKPETRLTTVGRNRLSAGEDQPTT